MLAWSLLAMAAALVPLYPLFPASTTLDDSWHLGLHQAMGQGFHFGRDLVFTFGPYFGIYTGEYHPATDALTLSAASYLALAFGLALYALGRSTPVLLIALLLLLSSMHHMKDALFFAYPLVVGLVVFRRFASQSGAQELTDRLRPGEAGLFALFISALGLLPLIKGSLLMVSLISSLLCAGLLATCRLGWLAAAFVALPAVTCVLFWAIAGQPIELLPSYFGNLLQIISGYTDAMSLEGTTSEIHVYLATAAVLAFVILQQPVHPWARIYLLAAFGLCLFVGFKAGFVRHDGHAAISAGTIAISALLLMSVASRSRAIALLAAFAAWLFINPVYATASGPHVLIDQVIASYVRLGQGILARTQGSDRLDELRASNLRRLGTECPLPRLDGTTDIYSYRQGCLIASGNAWLPRPILQSYSAYTPALARLNAQHLKGDRAPTHIFFRVEPIDGRLPSLEDGHSWPILINDYEFERLDGDLAILARGAEPTAGIPEARGEFAAHAMGQAIGVPKSGAMLAEFDLRRTALGQLASILFKSPELAIEVTLASGAQRRYRFVAGMAGAPFLFSPLVENTREFALVAAGNPAFLSDSAIVSFRITTSSIGARFWSDQVKVRFTPLPLKRSNSQATSALFDRPSDTAPLGGKASESIVCDGNVDRLNGRMPVPMEVRIGGILSVDGWTAVSARDGVLPEQVYVVLAPADGAPIYVRARSTPRPDVGDYFKQPALAQSGFVAQVDTSDLSGSYQLYVAQVKAGRLISCQPVRKLTIAR